MNTTIVFFGNERLASGLPAIECRVLPALLKAGYTVQAAVVQQRPTHSRQIRELEIGDVARNAAIPLLSLPELLTLQKKAAAHVADIGVLVAYGKLVPQVVISQFKHGIINLHPSLLPQFRGPTPIEQTILDGLEVTGISLMQLGAKMDAGPIFSQETFRLSGQETKVELAAALLALGEQLVLRQLPIIISGQSQAQPQEEDRATYSSLLQKTDGLIDSSKPARRLEREVRAFYGWPGSFMQIQGKNSIITRAQVRAGSLAVGDIRRTADECIAIGTTTELLVITHLKPAGKPEMEAAAFLRGLPQPLDVL